MRRLSLIILSLFILFSCTPEVHNTNSVRIVTLDCADMNSKASIWEVRTKFISDLVDMSEVEGTITDWRVVSTSDDKLQFALSEGYWLIEVRGRDSADDETPLYEGSTILLVHKDVETFSITPEKSVDNPKLGQFLKIKVNVTNAGSYSWHVIAIDKDNNRVSEDITFIDGEYITKGILLTGEWSVKVYATTDSDGIAYTYEERVSAKAIVIDGDTPNRDEQVYLIELSDDNLKKHEHTLSTTTTNATCTSDSLEIVTCTDTYCTYRKETVLKNKLGHSWKVTVVEATCEEDGYTEHNCIRCGTSYKDNETSALGHNLPDSYTKDASGHWKVCTRCNEVIRKETHTYGEETTEDGYKVRTCTVCGYEDREKTDCTHNYVLKHNNTQHWYECSMCGHTKEYEEHTLSSYESVNDDTHQRTCSVCNAVVTESHNYEAVSDGNKHWLQCSDCSHIKPESEAEHYYAISYFFEQSTNMLTISSYCEVCGYIPTAIEEEATGPFLITLLASKENMDIEKQKTGNKWKLSATDTKSGSKYKWLINGKNLSEILAEQGIEAGEISDNNSLSLTVSADGYYLVECIEVSEDGTRITFANRHVVVIIVDDEEK